ncbi:MAG: hypothetical protein AB4057_18805 [Crocosphaera sp.]
MLFNNDIGTHLNGLDSLRSKSRFLIAQNRSKQQHRQLSMLHPLASEMGVHVESVKA